MWASGSRVVVAVVVLVVVVLVVLVLVRSVFGSSVGPSAAPDASFCFWSCSFCRLRCFLRNLARRFLNQTFQTDQERPVCESRSQVDANNFKPCWMLHEGALS